MSLMCARIVRTLQDYGVLRTALLSRSCAACRDLAEKRTGLLQGIAELFWSYAHRPPKYLSKMARTMRSRVTNCRGVIAVACSILRSRAIGKPPR